MSSDQVDHMPILDFYHYVDGLEHMLDAQKDAAKRMNRRR